MPIDKSKIPVHRINNNGFIELNPNINLNNINNNGTYIILLKDNTNYNQPIYNETLPDNAVSLWKITMFSQNNLGIMTALSPNINSNYPNIYSRKLHPELGWQPWYQISGAGLDMPSNKFINLSGPTSSGQIYTAPANGYYSIKSRGQSTSTYILFDVLDENSNYLYAMRMLSTNTGDCEQIIPISKNYKLRFIYNNALDIEYFRFIYANSEVPMNERFKK